MVHAARRHFRSGPKEPQETLVGHSPAIQATRRKIPRLARHNTPVLISGESGTGKVLVARAIHGAEDGFYCVALSGLPADLIEAEMFGFEQGAFDFAKKPRPGVLELVSGGTACFKHFEVCPPSVYPRLLRVLRDRLVVRLGSQQPIPVNVRIIVTTSEDPATLVKTGVFPRDLFRALAVGRVHLPPLRERGDDIALLARHFASVYAPMFGDVDGDFTDEALAWLRVYRWPGNVRELANVVERAFALRHWPPTSKRSRRRPEARPIGLAELLRDG
jgi:DNA-binding NtrC family response regulator